MNTTIIENEISRNNKLLDFNWVRRVFFLGRLRICGVIPTIETFEDFRVLIRIINEVYENNWDIDFTIGRTNGKVLLDIHSIVIRFPDFNITNNDGNEHNIKDLFIKLPLSIINNRLKITDIKGSRTTLTMEEFESGYLHSHLNEAHLNPEDSFPRWKHFCLGSGEINIYMSEMNSKRFEEQTLYPFVMQLTVLANWESLEGVPYKYINTIRRQSRNSNARPFYAHAALTQDVFNAIKNSTLPLNLNFSLEGNKFSLKNNGVYDNTIRELCSSNIDNLLCVIDRDGRERTIESSRSLLNRNDPSLNFHETYVFRGEEYKFKILNPDTNEQQVEFSTEISPRLKQQVKDKIDVYINKQKIRKSTEKRYRG